MDQSHPGALELQPETRAKHPPQSVPTLFSPPTYHEVAGHERPGDHDAEQAEWRIAELEDGNEELSYQNKGLLK